jgi:hypothetical protein
MALSVSADGEIVDFNFDDRAEHQARFDLKTLTWGGSGQE